MAELKCQWRKCLTLLQRRYRKELTQPWQVCLEVWRQLKQHRTQFACLLHRLQYRGELGYSIFTFAQTLDVRYTLGSFEREAKSLWHGGEPVLEHRRRRQGAEGVVHLNGVQPSTVVLQKLLCGDSLRVKIGLPRDICPAGGPGKEMGRVAPDG